MNSENVVLPSFTHVPGPIAALKVAGSQSSRITTCLLELMADAPVASTSANSAVTPNVPRRRFSTSQPFLPCGDLPPAPKRFPRGWL